LRSVKPTARAANPRRRAMPTARPRRPSHCRTRSR
jgi:hypothetical protein